MLWYWDNGRQRCMSDGVVYELVDDQLVIVSRKLEIDSFLEDFPVGTRVMYNWGGGRYEGEIKGDDGRCLLVEGEGKHGVAVYGIPYSIVDVEEV